MEKFIQWSQLIMCGKIKPNEKIVLMVILNCNNMAWPFIAHSEIMKQSGLKETAVKEAIKSLRKMGLITKVKSNTNNMNNYIVSGFNLNGLITSGSDFDPLNTTETTSGSQNNPQVGRKTPDIYNINKKDIVKRVKENIKEKRESNEMINGKLNRKDEVKDKQSNNNMDFKKNGMYMELNSHPAVQSKDWAKETKEEKTHSSSAGTTKVIQIGDTRYAVETANTDYSSIWDSFPGGTASREKNKVQRVTTTEDRKDNTLSNASLHNENEDNPNEAKPTTAGQNTNPKTDLNSPNAAGATETAHRGFNGTQVDNYPTHTEKTPQERNNEGNMDTHNPMDCGGMSIDNLEDIYNGGQTIPTQPISKVRSQTTLKAKSNEGGGGRKFTPRKEWDIAMEEANHHIENSNPYHKPLVTVEDLRMITEGTTDKYRVIETLKTIKKMLSYRLKYTIYDIWLNNAIDTLEANEEVYSPKQYEYACEIHDDCVDLYNIITNN